MAWEELSEAYLGLLHVLSTFCPDVHLSPLHLPTAHCSNLVCWYSLRVLRSGALHTLHMEG